jgi:hypothetical protein
MKCPKCGYTSFDFNLSCPKCNKDLSLEQDRLNLPVFKPDPPSLLGGLLGDGQPGGHLGGSAAGSEAAQEPALSIESASDSQSGDGGLGDSQEIDLGLEFHEGKGLEVEGILEEPGSLLGDSPAAGKASPSDQTKILGISLDEAKGGEDQEEIALNLDEITLESIKPEEKGPAGRPDKQVEDDLGDFSLEDAGMSLEQPAPPLSSTEPLGLDLDHTSGKADQAREMGEITLSLEDLNVNETGQLEIGRHIPAAPKAKEPAKPAIPAMGQTKEVAPLPTDKEPEDDLSLLLSDDNIEISADPSEGIQAIDLENLDLELDLEGPERKGDS